MVYYVYLDSDVISKANDDGLLDALILCLRGLKDNCLLIDFEIEAINHDALEWNVKAIDHPWKQKTIGKIIKTLKKRNRFAFCLKRDSQNSEAIDVLMQSKEHQIDALIVPEIEDGWPVPDGTEVTALEDYTESEFEELRSENATNGIAPKWGEWTADQLKNNVLVKILKYAKTFDFCDQTFHHFRNDHQFSTVHLFECLGKNELLKNGSNESGKLKIWFRSFFPDKDDVDKDIEALLQKCKKDQLLDADIYLQYYVDRKIPHGRYIMTDQFTILIDPGLDFLIERTKCCNELAWSFKNADDIQKQIAEYDQYKHDDPVLI